MNCRIVVALMLSAAVVSAAELPVRTVVLYKHGVGYFERAGNLAAGESAKLDFKASEMNDVLKSLTVNDQGGKVTGVRYDSNIPLNQKLSEFPFAINNGEPLSAMLDQLKGARIEMEFGPQKTSGAIVSARLVAADKEHAEREQLTLLMDSGELRNVDLSAASTIRFPDPKLQLQFRDYLAAVTGARSKDKRSVYIDSTDSKSRDVRATYIMPMPAWKSSYRLLFDESGQQPVLEGWAIVDNTTDDDWTNVRLTLVSGKPISFISELYDPRYINRKTADLPEDQSVGLVIHSGAMAPAAKAEAALRYRQSRLTRDPALIWFRHALGVGAGESRRCRVFQLSLLPKTDLCGRDHEQKGGAPHDMFSQSTEAVFRASLSKDCLDAAVSEIHYPVDER